MSICMLVLSSIIPVSADGNSSIKSSDIQAEREDVPLEEALQDPTFSINNAFEEELIGARSTSWEVWGEIQYRTSDNTARPIGYSQHVSNGKVLDTFHYTRTYLDGGILGGKKGDSGRIWGTGTVKAIGTYCMMDVWANRTHKVKYRTED